MKTAVLLLWLTIEGFAQTGSPGYTAYRQGEALFEKGKFQESLIEIDRALGLDPRLIPALTLRAKLAMSMNRYDVAQEALEWALRVDPAAWYAQFLLGFLDYQQNRIPDAKTALEKARQLNPKDPRATLYLGLTNETLGNTAQARTLYRQAMALEESSGKPHAEAWLAYTRMLLVEGDLGEAAKQIERAKQIDPQSRDVHFESGRLLLKKGALREAAQEGETALRLAGEVTDRRVHFLLVQAYQAMGREKEVARHADAIRATEQR